MTLPENKDAKVHENASTQIDVPSGVAARIIEIGKKLIPDEALAGDGRVEHSHVTLKYGVSEDEQALQQALVGQQPFTVTLGKVLVFEPSESSGGGSPVVVEAHAPQLEPLKDAIGERMGKFKDTFAYSPHVTVAYVKPDQAEQFAGSDAFAGITFQAAAVTLSSKDDNSQAKFPLGKKAYVGWRLRLDENMGHGGGGGSVVAMNYAGVIAAMYFSRRGEHTYISHTDPDRLPAGMFAAMVGKLEDEYGQVDLTQAQSRRLWGDKPKAAAVLPEIPQRPEVKRDEPAVQAEPQPEPEQKKPAPKKQPKPKKQMTPRDADKLVGDSARKTKKKQKPMRPTETPQFKAWFSGSKIVKDGELGLTPLMVFHGTTHDFQRFDDANANAEGWYGPGFYFTDSQVDVAENYATAKGADLTHNIEGRADAIMDGLREMYEEENHRNLDYNSEDYKTLWAKAYDAAKVEFVGPNQGVTMPVYLSVQNPVYVIKNGGTQFNIDFDEETGEESGSGLELYNALNLAGGNFGGDVSGIWNTVSENGGEFSAWDFEDAVRASEDIMDDEGRMVPGNLIAQVYQEMGFDGVVQDAWHTFGGGAHGPGHGMKMDEGTRHYIVWDASKIKSAIGNVGTWDPKSPSITASASPALQRWFGASKVVDDKFEPRVVYHGSRSPWLTSFDMGMEGTGVQGHGKKWGAIWFTSSAENAEEFADPKEEKVEASIDEVTVYGNDPFYAAVYDINGESLFEVGPHPTEEEAERDGVAQATEYNKHLGENTNVQGYYLKIVRPYVTDQVPRQEEFAAAKAGKHDGIIARDVIDGYTRSDVFVVFSPTQVKSTRSVKFDPASPHVTAAVQPEAKDRLGMLGQDVVEEATIGDYDLFVTYDRNFGVYQIGMQRVGMDASDIEQQVGERRQDRGRGDRREIVRTVQGWVDKYHLLIIGSMNPAKTEKYVRLLRMLGFKPVEKDLMGIPFAMLTDGTIKLGSAKLAGRKDAVTSLVMRADVEGFPVVWVRWEGLRWRQVLKAVKAIAGEVAGHRVPWDDIQIFNSPWKSLDEQEAGWHSSKSSGQVMFDVLKNGSWVSVGGPYKPEAEAAGATEHPWDGNSAYERHALNMWAEKESGKDISGQPEWVLGRVAAWEKIGADLGLANRVMDELFPVLGGDLPKPELTMVNQPRAGWLGMNNWRIFINGGGIGWDSNTTIKLQKYILSDENTLRRIIAHELCHHADSLVNGVKELERYKSFGMIGYKTFLRGQVGTGHGSTWKQYAALYNAKYGAGFVTEKSDESYVQEELPLKPYYIRLWKQPNGKIYYSVSTRIGPRIKKYLERKAVEPDPAERMTKTDSRLFMRGATIGDGWSSPQGKDAEAKTKMLAELWETAQPDKQAPLPQKSQDELELMEKMRNWKLQASHKTPPLSDTQYENPEYGMETNAYADIPERVKGTYDTPTLEELAPQMFAKDSASQVRYTLSLDKSGGEVRAWDGDKNVGWVLFFEAENEGAREIHVRMVYVHPDHRRMGIGAGMYERIKQEFPGERIVSSATTGEGGEFRKKLTERGVLAKQGSHFQFPSFEEYLRAHPETLEDPDDPEEYAHKEFDYDDTVAGLDFDFPLVVYRSVELPVGQEPNFQETGVFWSSNPDSAQAYFGSTSIWSPKTTEPKVETREVLIAAQVLKPEDVEWYQTLVANMVNPEENEVTVAKGSQLRLVAVDGKKVKRRMITAAYAEAQNQVQHTDQRAVGMSKTLKGDPFHEEYALLHGGKAPFNPGPPAGDGPASNTVPKAEGEDELHTVTSAAAGEGYVFKNIPSVRTKHDKTYTTPEGETFETLDETPPNPLFEQQFGQPFDKKRNVESPKRPVVDTPEFRAWFGDSKVVNNKGEPLMMFHGTRARKDFDTFKTSPVKGEGGWSAKGKPGDPFDAIGAWFAADKKLLNEVHDFYRMRRKGPPRTMPVYLSIKSPLYVDQRQDLEGRIHQLIKKWLPKQWAKWQGTWDDWSEEPARMAQAKAARKACEMAGYDGIRLANDYHGEAWVAFYPNQIKSALGNSQFDPKNPSITAAETDLFHRVAGGVPKAALAKAQEMLDALGGNTMLCGDSEVVDGWWVETHTLGCRNAADEPEDQWQESHDRLLDEYRADGVSHVIMDDSGIFATVTPQRPKQAASYGKFTGEQVVDHVLSQHKDWSRDTAYQVVGLDAGGDYKLRDYPLRRLVAGDDYDPSLAERYAKMGTPLPPIVLDGDGRIRDGNHRVAAGKIRGDKTIQAYVPIDTFKTAAPDYEGMFKAVLPLTPEGAGEYSARVKAEIEWARKDLKKQDRIVWWLRWFRLAILDDMQKDLPDQGLGMETPAQPQQKPPLTLLTQPGQPPAPQAEQPDPDQQWQAKLRQAYKNELKAMAGRSPGPWSVRPLHWFTKSTHERFQHLMSLPVAKIQNTVWDKQTPDALVQALEGYELEWQENVKGLVEIQEGDEVMLQFADGWAWWKLSRAYCPEEARAMGHCGNVVGQDKPDERILSLRKPVKVENETMWEPHCTFILEPSNLLGEMKGKANQKPVAAYHKYIVPLLELPAIAGIRGGGYAPKQNFSLADLPKEEQERLVAAKPGLLNCEMFLNKYGITQDLVQRISASLEWDLKWLPNLKGYDMGTYPSLDNFIQERGDDTAQYVGKVMDGTEYIDIEGTSYDDAIDNLDRAHEKVVADYLRLNYADAIAEWENQHDETWDGGDSDMKRLLEDDFNEELDEPKELLRQAIDTGRRWGMEQAMQKSLMDGIDNMSEAEGNTMGVSVAYQSHKNPATGKASPVWDSPLTEYIPIDSAAKMADSGSTWDDFQNNEVYGYDNGTPPLTVDQPHYGWDGFDKNGFFQEIMDNFGPKKAQPQPVAEATNA